MALRPSPCSHAEDGAASGDLSPSAHGEESVFEGVDGEILVLLDQAHSPHLDIPDVAISVKSKAWGRLAARSSMQGAIVDDEGLALLNRNSESLDGTNAFVLELEAAEVVPNAMLSLVAPGLDGLDSTRRFFSNPMILSRTCWRASTRRRSIRSIERIARNPLTRMMRYWRFLADQCEPCQEGVKGVR